MPSRRRCAGNGASKSVRASVPPPSAELLTPREEEVARWIGEGKRNSEIASILGCSPRTVETHVHNILEKLHLETRTNICAWWHLHRRGKADPPGETAN